MGATISPPTRRAMIQTGTYTGNGADDRNLDIGVDLAAKNNAYVIIKGVGTERGRHRTEYAQGDLTMRFDNAADSVNVIQAFTATGFQLGSSTEGNANTQIYRYIAMWEEP